MGRPKSKSTAAEAPAEETKAIADVVRGTRASSDLVRSNRASSDVSEPVDYIQDADKYGAQTPSPFLHPACAPNMLAMQGYDLGASVPIAFGDIPADFTLSGFSDEQATYGQFDASSMMYDPTSGMYVPYDWQQQPFIYNQGGYPMMDMGMDDPFGQIGCMTMNSCGEVTENLLQALSEKIADDKTRSGLNPYSAPTYDENGLPVPEAMGGPCDLLPGQEALYDPCAEIFPAAGSNEYGQQQGNSSSGRKNRNRDRGDRDRGERADRDDVQGDVKKWETEASQQGPVNFTTVMFRNIPNKYTREMLVKQLESDLKGEFDFVYLPIDFKNKCNVGYAFINFRSIEACEAFLKNFNGVEVRKCLPGLNSRKVTEVTPARVQGFEENVQRLRNSPVMRELAHHTEWMPLIFDETGKQMPFPSPERALEPIKLRRRGREERDY
jgi:hypothetical protein